MSKGHTYMLVAYSCSGQMSKGRTYALVAHTCGGQMSAGRAYTPVAYTCAVGKYLRDMPTSCSHTPALDKCV